MERSIKRLVLIGIISALVLALFSGCSKAAGEGSILKASSMTAYKNDDGSLYFPSSDGTAYNVNGELERGRLTADGKRVVMVDIDGTLYWGDKKGSKTTISDDVNYYTLQNDGVVYSVEVEKEITYTLDEIIEMLLSDGGYVDTVEEAIDVMVERGYEKTVKGAKEFYEDLLGRSFDEYYGGSTYVYKMYRYIFDSKSKIELGEIGSYIMAEDTTSVIYEKDGAVYVLKYNDEDPVKIKNLGDGVDFGAGGISNDGELAFWLEQKYGSGSYDLYSMEGTSYKKAVSNFEVSYMDCYAVFSQDSSKGICVPYNGDFIILKEKGKSDVRVRLGATSGYIDIFSDRDSLYDDDSGKWDNLYVMVSATENYNLYHVTWGGDRTRVKSNIKHMEIKQGIFYFTDGKGALNRAKLVGSELEDEVKIASGVYNFRATQDGKTVFYLRNYDQDDEVGVLYYSESGKEGVKITGDVWQAYSLCTDSRSILYYTDVQEGEVVRSYKDYDGTDHQYEYTFYYGDLKMYTAGKDEPENIIREAFLYQLQDNYYSSSGQIVDRDGFFAVKYDYADTAAYGTLYYYNGKETVKLATDLIIH